MPIFNKRKSHTTVHLNRLVDEVLKGWWGDGEIRKQELEAKGYDYNIVQEAVNLRMKQIAKGKATMPVQTTTCLPPSQMEKLPWERSDYEALMYLKQKALDTLSCSMPQRYDIDNGATTTGSILVDENSITIQVENSYSFQAWFKRDSEGKKIYDPEQGEIAIMLVNEYVHEQTNFSFRAAVYEAHRLLLEVDERIERGETNEK